MDRPALQTNSMIFLHKRMRPFDKGEVTIHEYWTGWGKLKDTVTEYSIQEYPEFEPESEEN